MRKGKDPEPDPYIWLMDQDPEGPETSGSGEKGKTWSQIRILTSDLKDPDPDPQHCKEVICSRML